MFVRKDQGIQGTNRLSPHVQPYLPKFNLRFYCDMEIRVISKANRWSPRVQLYVPTRKGQKVGERKVKKALKKEKRKDTVGINRQIGGE